MGVDLTKGFAEFIPHLDLVLEWAEAVVRAGVVAEVEADVEVEAELRLRLRLRLRLISRRCCFSRQRHWSG